LAETHCPDVSPCCRETHNIVEERRVKEEEKSVYEEVEDHDDLFFVQNYDTQADLPHNMKVLRVLLAIFCIFFFWRARVQGCGSGSAWVRINLSCWIRIRIQEGKMTQKYRKSKEFSCFEVLDVLFGLKASSLAYASFIET
jgi:hypothetical protein